MNTDNIVALYEMTPPDGPAFKAAIDGDWKVLSNRSGEWRKESVWKAVDLMHPHISFNEWDIKKLPLEADSPGHSK